MELTKEQLKYISNQISEGDLLEEILLSKFPDAEITIIRQYDAPFNTYDVVRAFFSRNRARSSLGGLKRPRNIWEEPSVEYELLTGTVADLERGKLNNQTVRPPLDDAEMILIYALLSERLRK